MAKGDEKAQKPAAKKAASPQRKVGRPEDYTEEKVARICEELATGLSLKFICDNHKDLPDKSTIFRWMYRHPEFRDKYIVAKNVGMFAWGEENVEIADDATNDYMEREGKAPLFNSENVQRSKLRIWTRMWHMERLQPKVFGQKVDHNHGVQPDNPLTEILSQVSGAVLRPTESTDEGEGGDG